MTEEAKAKRREYKRNWNRNNPDKVKAATERYWERQAEQAKMAPTATADNRKGV